MQENTKPAVALGPHHHHKPQDAGSSNYEICHVAGRRYDYIWWEQSMKSQVDRVAAIQIWQRVAGGQISKRRTGLRVCGQLERNKEVRKERKNQQQQQQQQ